MCGEIESKEDLVVSTQIYHFVAYHNSCYSKTIKGFNTIFVSNVPINGTYGTFAAIVSAFIALVLLFFEPLRWYSLLFSIVPLARLYAWYKFERFLP